MSTLVDARGLLFHTLLGDTPPLAPEVLAQVKSLVASYTDVCAAFDELVRVIVSVEKPATEKATQPATAVDGYLHLHDYVEAQLEGRVYAAEFADLRRRLDKDVALAEAYALLYETLQAEQQDRLPTPAMIPPPDLTFLQRAAPPRPRLVSARQSSIAVAWRMAVAGWPWLTSLLAVGGALWVWAPPTMPVGPLLLLLGCTILGVALLTMRRGGMAAPSAWYGEWRLALCALLIAGAGAALWVNIAHERSWRAMTPDAAPPPAAPTRLFVELQLGLEAQLPTPATARVLPESQPHTLPCIDYQRGLFFRKVCPV
jgi:hypothetical protein